MTHNEILAAVGRYSLGADISLIEGNKGLYDGLDLHGSNSNAALATLTKTPVILVLDARGMTRGIAPLILGYQAFDPEVKIAGVILNQLGGSRHEAKLRTVIEHYTDIPVIGGVHRNHSMEIVERHLGLVPSNEDASAVNKIREISNLIKDQVDLDQLLAAAATKPLSFTPQEFDPPADSTAVKIGIARDAAFGFYYPDDLDALTRAGAILVPFNTLTDTNLPDIDGLFIGGGFPESHMQALAANTALRTAIRTAINNGLPGYAECGGMMYLSRKLSWNDRHSEMVGVIPADTVMHARPQGRGYVRLRETAVAPWPASRPQGEFAAHEFHYSSLENITGPLTYAYEVTRGHGIDGRNDGIVINNLLACYSHMRDTDQHHWARRFVEFVRMHRG